VLIAIVSLLHQQWWQSSTRMRYRSHLSAAALSECACVLCY
jgi:hypothetical protein